MCIIRVNTSIKKENRSSLVKKGIDFPSIRTFTSENLSM